MSTNNPDFTPQAKRLIVKTVQTVLGPSEDNTNVRRPAYPRSGGIGAPQYDKQVLQGTAQNVTGWAFVKGHSMA